MLTLVSRVVVRRIALSGPSYQKLPDVPNGTQAADVRCDLSWEFRTDPASPGYAVDGNYDRHLPGSFVKDLYFQPGRTYQIVFYVG